MPVVKSLVLDFFRVVNETAFYHVVDDAIFIENKNVNSEVVNGILGVNFLLYHKNLCNLYMNTLYQLNI